MTFYERSYYISDNILHGSYRSGLHPFLDVWNISNSFNQVGKLGEPLENTLVREITDVHERVEISPGEVVPHKILATTASQLLFKLAKSGWNCYLSRFPCQLHPDLE